MQPDSQVRVAFRSYFRQIKKASGDTIASAMTNPGKRYPKADEASVGLVSIKPGIDDRKGPASSASSLV
jgi:hypothetical protein